MRFSPGSVYKPNANNESRPSIIVAKVSHQTGATCRFSQSIDKRQHVPDTRLEGVGGGGDKGLQPAGEKK